MRTYYRSTRKQRSLLAWRSRCDERNGNHYCLFPRIVEGEWVFLQWVWRCCVGGGYDGPDYALRLKKPDWFWGEKNDTANQK